MFICWSGRGESERWYRHNCARMLGGLTEKLEVHEREMC